MTKLDFRLQDLKVLFYNNDDNDNVGDSLSHNCDHITNKDTFKIQLHINIPGKISLTEYLFLN